MVPAHQLRQKLICISFTVRMLPTWRDKSPSRSRSPVTPLTRLANTGAAAKCALSPDAAAAYAIRHEQRLRP